MTSKIKFMYNGIKIDSKLIKGFWSYGNSTNKNIKATFYVKDYDNNHRKLLTEYFKVENDSDIMTDYFETDRIRFMLNDKNIDQIKKAWKQQELKYINRSKYLGEKEKAQRIKEVMTA